MSEFFKAYKDYIVKHPKKREYKPTSDKDYDRDKLYDVYKKVGPSINPTEQDAKKIQDFVKISTYLHDLYVDLYTRVKDNLTHLNLKGIEIASYLVACLNREYKVVWDKHLASMKNAAKGSYYTSDFANFKLESPKEDVGLVDVRACLESATDSFSLLLNYLRHFLDEELTNENSNPEEFAGRLLHMFEMTQMAVVFKHSYDDILYNDGYITTDENNHTIVFDYDSHENLMLLRAGDMMFSERRLHVMSQEIHGNEKLRLFKYVTDRRIKRVKVVDSTITLDFGQGEPKEHKGVVRDLQAAIDAFYEFLDGNTLLPNMANATIDEAISIWGAIQYICMHVSSKENYDVALNRIEDFTVVPSKILKQDLFDYVVKLTSISKAKVKKVIEGLEANWKSYNDIWSSMIYPVGEYYLLPFYPVIYSAPYNVIDQLLLRGGVNLDTRGKIFEKYIYNQLTKKKTSYPVTCIPAGEYGTKTDFEEIDVVVGLKNVVLVADAKCIHYSVEPMNYADAWSRLEEGCEQAVRKAEFVRKRPDLFPSLGDTSNKKFVPFVLTNYPTFTGFSHNGVYVIDSHSFLAYMQGGYITMRQLGLESDPVIAAKRFYHNEDQFSDNFENYLMKNPLKEEFKKRIYIHDLPILTGVEPWKVIAKSAQVMNDPQFNIANG